MSDTKTRGGDVLFGMAVDALTLEQVVTLTQASLRTRQRLQIGVVNAAKVVKLTEDEFLRNSLLTCDVLLADGQSVVWASRLLGHPLPERVAGIDLFVALLEMAHQDGDSIYLLGAEPSVLATLEGVVGERWPGLRIAGSHHGYFDPDDSATIAADIAASDADMLFIGMTTPAKEIFLGTYGDSLGVPVMHGVGGSFDVLAGVTKRAPQAWQSVGMEWAYRLYQEPRRLWRRYLYTNTAFLRLLANERVHPRAPYRPSPRPSAQRSQVATSLIPSPRASRESSYG